METSAEQNAPKASKNLETGDTFLDGRFHLVEPVDSGDFGVAWVAHDPVRKSKATLKYLLDCVSLDEVEIAKFSEETKWALFEEQPNIVRVFELNHPSNASELVHRLIEQSSDQKSQTFFDVADIEEWIKLLCQSLQQFHHQKESKTNESDRIYVKEDSREDFEFRVSSRADETVARLTGVATIFSTAYGSPEQALGAFPDEKQDVYAIGALIYDLLTGKPPFFHGDVLTQIQQVEPPSMSARRREFHQKGGLIPQRWEETIAACLSKDPNRRPDFSTLITRLFKEEGPLRSKKAFPFAPIGAIALGAFILIAHGSRKEKEESQGGTPMKLASVENFTATGILPVQAPSTPPPPSLVKTSLPSRYPESDFKLALPKPPRIEPTDEAKTMQLVQNEKLFARIIDPEPAPRFLEQLPLFPEPNTVGDVKIDAAETHCPIKKGTPFFLEDIGMDMVWIELLDSWVAKSEVTQEQFAKGGGKFRRQRYKGPDRAQNSVSWNQAMEFCRALTDNEKQKGHLPEGFVFTLPSEDQWKVFVGDAGPNHAVYGNRESKGPSPPGTRSENQYGLVDVRGNLWEWTLTDYSSQNPSKGKALRGGSFVTSRSMLMNDNARFYGDKNNSYYQYGFRFVLTTEKS